MEEGREEGREGGREGREGGRQGGREGEREAGREAGRQGGRQGGRGGRGVWTKLSIKLNQFTHAWSDVPSEIEHKFSLMLWQGNL